MKYVLFPTPALADKIGTAMVGRPETAEEVEITPEMIRRVTYEQCAAAARAVTACFANAELMAKENWAAEIGVRAYLAAQAHDRRTM